ncbi:membrane-bound lytic murein transglycosylase MltF [Vibrio mangrovi]|uniref:Membrane-bound lytic murein transglycosylase F n=1 Tax=Vibrio mangrovi TaxID=474394 RepID=A0A1Y6IV06_9VIBR|nr:membrane-bound lytic murein transglycosylase MltF [Vibrio mangrovi]MDW6003337.1 membrane-bound lytic murein transglycosylase MltF [Vibrio mangrovi]SMR99873.1 Membrane-bound lytic murein transglycosylase F precursor [Vibrio mangrovi]
MIRIFQRQTLIILALTSITALLSGCQIDSKPKSELDQIRERGVLRVGTVNNQLSYFIGPEGPSGMDYELAREFANELGVKLEMRPVYRVSSLFPALKKGEVDIVAAGQIQTAQRVQSFRPGPAYYYVSQQVVYRQGQWHPRNMQQLIQKQKDLSGLAPQVQVLNVVDDSHFEQTLVRLKRKYPDFLYQIEPDSDVHDLLRKVSQGELMFTIADSVEVSLAQRIYPDLATAFEITDDQPISWFIRRSDDESLYALMIEFFGNQKQSGTIASLEEKYIGHVGTFDYVDTRAFIRALDSRLPKWTPLFRKYAGEFDWRLIAALSYQESHWNPRAKSPTGVRGMMMLTLATAKSVGITNRLNPEQSIQGGVKYLRRMISRVPDSIPDHEKIWFALASYNMGYGHMMDARDLTRVQGGDPDAWGDVKDRLPLLRKRRYFSQTRYGYARGDEALAYVENIRRYYQSMIGHIDTTSTADNSGIGIDDLTVIPAMIADSDDDTELDTSAQNIESGEDLPTVSETAPAATH